MHCLVLGGAGFIGSHIVDALVTGGHQVRVFDLPTVNRHNLKQSIEDIHIEGGDFDNISDISHALEDIDVVVHLVSTTFPGPSNENPAYDVETNVVGTLNLLKESVRQGVRKVIFASSGGTVYGIPQLLPVPEDHPTNPFCSYGITKLTIEKYLGLFHHLYNLDYTILRLGNPYGPRQRIDNVQGAIAVFLGQILHKKEITVWGDGTVARDYFYVSDLVTAFIKAIETDSSSKIFNIGSGQACSLNEIIAVIHQVTGENPIVRFTAGRKLDVPISCLDVSLAERVLEWKPLISLHEGIARTWEWLKSL